MNIDNIVELRRDLAAVHRIIYLESMHEGTWTHLSIRFSDDNSLLVTPGDTYFSEVTASSLLHYSASGSLISGDGCANIDAIPIHRPVYDSRDDVFCILHLHSPYCTALTLLESGRLNTRASQMAAIFHENIGYLDRYALPREDVDEGAVMAAALAEKKVLFLKNHGVLVVSESIHDAIFCAYNLERAAMFQILAMQTGESLAEMSVEAASHIASEEFVRDTGYLEGMKTMLNRKHPDYYS